MQEKKQYLFLSLGIFVFILWGLGCSSTPEPVKEPVPEWIESMPEDDAYYYALGVSGPMPRINDAWDQAIKRARAELGRLIFTHVRSSDSIIASTRGEYVQQIVEILSDAELNYTEVIERWFDQQGSYGFPEHCYVLVRLEKKKAESILRSVK
ncbi:MAG: LPP20 family lipoprotein [Deltaproteobacteria bacterium]|nr:LPP20 family lipoprotein [Deltaproteobacteria bacterium]